MSHVTSRIVKGGDLNGTHNLFGGRALEWIDEDAALAAFFALGPYRSIVTKAMSSVVFEAPAKHGDIVSTVCKVIKAGRTSITVDCTMKNATTGLDIITIKEIVLVNIDEDGKPAPHGFVMNPINN